MSAYELGKRVSVLVSYISFFKQNKKDLLGECVEQVHYNAELKSVLVQTLFIYSTMYIFVEKKLK